MSDTAKFVLTVTGSDRPGLTSELSQAVLDAQGNWTEGHLSRLGGLYVGSVLIEVPTTGIEALKSAIAAVDPELSVNIHAAGSEPDSMGTSLVFELIGQDRPGIIREVTAALAKLGANIERLSSGEKTGAWAGEHLFYAEVQAVLPDGIEPEQAQDALEAISSEIMVDFSFASEPG